MKKLVRIIRLKVWEIKNSPVYLRQYCLLFCQLYRVLRKILVFRLKISIIPDTLYSATIAQLVRAPP